VLPSILLRVLIPCAYVCEQIPDIQLPSFRTTPASVFHDAASTRPSIFSYKFKASRLPTPLICTTPARAGFPVEVAAHAGLLRYHVPPAVLGCQGVCVCCAGSHCFSAGVCVCERPYEV